MMAAVFVQDAYTEKPPISESVSESRDAYTEKPPYPSRYPSRVIRIRRNPISKSVSESRDAYTENPISESVSESGDAYTENPLPPHPPCRRRSNGHTVRTRTHLCLASSASLCACAGQEVRVAGFGFSLLSLCPRTSLVPARGAGGDRG